jgi:hypothetical protein
MSRLSKIEDPLEAFGTFVGKHQTYKRLSSFQAFLSSLQSSFPFLHFQQCLLRLALYRLLFVQPWFVFSTTPTS